MACTRRTCWPCRLLRPNSSSNNSNGQDRRKPHQSDIPTTPHTRRTVLADHHRWLRYPSLALTHAGGTQLLGSTASPAATTAAAARDRRLSVSADESGQVAERSNLYTIECRKRKSPASAARSISGGDHHRHPMRRECGTGSRLEDTRIRRTQRRIRTIRTLIPVDQQEQDSHRVRSSQICCRCWITRRPRLRI